MKKRFIAVLSMALLCLTASAQFKSGQKIPTDPDLRTGKLSNGFTYYILHNEEPKARADFYIIYNIGALQEDDSQNGLAHFLEHMAFNGSKHFPGGNSEPTSIVKTLERHGVAFGKNINAYTAQDRTVYYMNDVTTTDSALIDTCLLVLHDWACDLTLDGTEIDNERGVISEEWRTRNNATARMRAQWTPILFGDTKWRTHDVIGDYDIINNFKYDELRAFYKKWYYPANQAVAIVGDVDVDEIEKKVSDLFSTIPSPQDPAVRVVEKLPENDEPLFALATDPEQSTNQIQIFIPMPVTPEYTFDSERADLVKTFYNDMLQNRISELIMSGDQNLIAGSASISDLLSGYEAYGMAAIASPGKESAALKSIYAEVIRAKRFGFTQDELDRVKASMNASLEQVKDRIGKIPNKTFAGQLVETFAYGKLFADMEDTYKLGKQLTSLVTLDEVNKFAASQPQFKNVRIIAMAPSGQDTYPTREGVLAALKEVDDDQTIAPYNEEDYSGGLIDHPVNPGKIVKEKALPVFGAKEWTLSNGARVVYAKADYDKSQVSLKSMSYGGLSLLDDDQVKAGNLIGQIPSFCGIGKFNPNNLKKALADKKVNTSITLTDETEQISGTSTTQDFETMLQEVYLMFTEPRFDESQYIAMSQRLVALLDMMGATPDLAISDSLKRITTNYSPRAVPENADMFRDVKLDEIIPLYKDRICDASDFVFFITGDIDEDAVRPAVEKYIGSIPSLYRKEKFIDHHVGAPEGYTEKTVDIKFTTPKANVNLYYEADFKLSQKNFLAMTVARNILNSRYITNIREKEGGTYGVSSSIVAKHLPVNNIVYKLAFDTEPSKAAYLKDLVKKEIESLCRDGVTDAELDNVVKNLLKEREQSKTKNKFVEDNLYNYVVYGEDNANPKNYEDILKKMKPSDVRKVAARYFKKADLVDIVFTNLSE